MIINFKGSNSYDQGYEDGFASGEAVQKSRLTEETVTDNGVYERTDGYKKVVVNVPQSEPFMQDKYEQITDTVTDIYPDEGYDGLSSVTVDASEIENTMYNQGYNDGIDTGKQQQKALLEPITITDNGTYQREDGYNEVIVNVQGGEPTIKEGTAIFDNCYFMTEMQYKSGLSMTIEGLNIYENSPGWIFGSRYANANNSFDLLWESGNLRPGIGNKEAVSYLGFAYAKGNTINLTYNVASTASVIATDADGVEISNKSVSSVTVGTRYYPIVFGALFTAGVPTSTSYFKGEVKSIKFTLNGVLYHEYVFREVNGMGMVYDKTTNRYILPLGNGNITIKDE